MVCPTARTQHVSRMRDRDVLMVARLHRPVGLGSPERYSADFVVNGVSLFSATDAHTLGMCGRFTAGFPELNEATRLAFLGDGPPDERLALHRTVVLNCATCGGLDCGAITLEVRRDGEAFIWRAFAYENGYEDPDLASYEHLGPFRFEAAAYRAAIDQAQRVDKD